MGWSTPAEPYPEESVMKEQLEKAYAESVLAQFKPRPQGDLARTDVQKNNS